MTTVPQNTESSDDIRRVVVRAAGYVIGRSSDPEAESFADAMRITYMGPHTKSECHFAPGATSLSDFFLKVGLECLQRAVFEGASYDSLKPVLVGLKKETQKGGNDTANA